MKLLRRIEDAYQLWSPAQRVASLAVVPLAALALVGSLRLVAVATEEAEPLQFAICSENLASLEVVPGGEPGSFGVAVRLTQPAAEELARLSDARAGSELEVVFSRWVFARMPIDSRIRSGELPSQSFPSQADAEGALIELESVLPARPCGFLP